MIKNKKVAIVGTNGIPAQYGGFETLAENLTKCLNRQYVFLVFCSKKQKKKLKFYNNSRLINIPLNANGVSGLLFDFISLIYALFFVDIIIYLGPGLGSLLWINKFFKKKIITNHGGLNEWNRDKLGFFQKKIAYINHKYASKYSDINIVDNFVLQKSLLKEFNVNSNVIRYGGDHVNKVSITDDLIKDFPFLEKKFYVSVSRAQIDNNLHLVLEAFKKMPDKVLVLISNWNVSEYGTKLKKEYSNISNIYLQDAVYDLEKLNCIRSNAYIYIHSHSQCGTAPSLVEAICLDLPILSFDVAQNRETLQRDDFFYNSSETLVKLVNTINTTDVIKLKKGSENLKSQYKWQRIAEQYSRLINNKYT